MKKSIGVRLKEERERLGLSQAAMGDIGGVKK
ncbi:XRE family transcriptional regulator, partial [Salmonella enterica]